MQIITDSDTGTETVKLKRGEESAIDDALAWLASAAKFPARFPKAAETLASLKECRAHVDNPPQPAEAKGK